MINRHTKKEKLENGSLSVKEKTFGGYCPAHWHEFYEIEYITGGSGEYIVDGKSYPAEPGTLTFMTPVNFHSFSGDISLYSIKFTETACDPLCLSHIATGDFPPAVKIPVADAPFFETLLRELVNNAGDLKYSSLLLEALLTKLKKTATRNNETKLPPVSASELFILNNFRDNISLNDVAAYVGFSPSYFSSLFKKTTGKSFKKYITELKMECARKLLEFSDYTVLQICMESGFDEYTNFLRRFKEYYGVTPGELRKISKKGM